MHSLPFVRLFGHEFQLMRCENGEPDSAQIRVLRYHRVVPPDTAQSVSNVNDGSDVSDVRRPLRR